MMLLVKYHIRYPNSKHPNCRAWSFAVVAMAHLQVKKKDESYSLIYPRKKVFHFQGDIPIAIIGYSMKFH